MRRSWCTPAICPTTAWLDDRLDERRGEPVFVFLHHPLFRIGIGSLDASRLTPADALAVALKRHGRVRHIFYGHVHRAIAGSWHGIPTTTLPGTNHQVALYLGPEPDMIGSHEASACGVGLIDDECVTVHYQDPLDRSPRFVLIDPRSKQAASTADPIS